MGHTVPQTASIKAHQDKHKAPTQPLHHPLSLQVRTRPYGPVGDSSVKLTTIAGAAIPSTFTCLSTVKRFFPHKGIVVLHHMVAWRSPSQ